MEKFLRHLVNITGHRDQGLLDISVVLAIHELTDAQQVRILDIFPYRAALFVQQRVWIRDGEVVSEPDPGPDRPGVPIASYAVLASCVEQRKKFDEEVTPEGIHILWFPVWLNEKISGCVEISQSTACERDKLVLIQTLLDVYHNSLALLDYSQRDSLTGLFNRKTFDEKFAKMAFSLAPNENQSLNEDDERRQHAEVKAQWLAVVDIDHFKRVNDQFGHLYGDEVLILVANLMRESFRAQDRVFRFGGEEFVVLLRSTTSDNAKAIFERFRQEVERHDFPQVGQVTISLGFVRISMETPVVILGHADQALYYAKEHGRNQVCSYDELVSAGLLRAEVSSDNVEIFF